VENRVRCRGLYLTAALAIAVVMGLAAVPVLAQDGEGKVGTQVVGGKPVPNGKYPFMTSIQADTSDRPPYKEHFCGGTLIDKDSVLTAAHCAVFIGRKTHEGTLGYRDVRLDVGVTVLNSDQGQRRRIERNYKFDVAVIQLARPVNNIELTALAQPSSGDGLETPPDDAIVAGWGDKRLQPPTGEMPSQFPKRMQEGDPPLVSDADCKDVYNRLDADLDVFPRLMVCAGQTAEDTCEGDSGGPMFAKSSGKYRQIGITSYGLGCGATGFPGVYTEVNAEPIYDFITQATGL
jgi:secreted trypsin-like serine protease